MTLFGRFYSSYKYKKLHWRRWRVDIEYTVRMQQVEIMELQDDEENSDNDLEEMETTARWI